MKIPRHLAIIMDGNGRWATSKGLPRLSGHERGADRVEEIVTACRELGVQVLTLYSFSTENWRRPKDEVWGLMNLLKRYVLSQRRKLLDNNIQLRAIGEVTKLPKFVQIPLRALIKESSGNTGMVLNLALSYGSRMEITHAVKEISKQVSQGRIAPDTIDENMVSSFLFTSDLPDPDLLIRTSGENRLSNFLLWQLAYAEFYIDTVPWPEFTRTHLEAAFVSFANRERRYGMTGNQLRGTDN